MAYPYAAPFGRYACESAFLPICAFYPEGAEQEFSVKGPETRACHVSGLSDRRFSRNTSKPEPLLSTAAKIRHQPNGSWRPAALDYESDCSP